ncbi:ParB/RepB/Spo0J family partition protein [Desulfonatronospira sp.]|uniref:ParB/RepB/Spo0J family partition protein n=1 Tax=Desulfonatronospira sp. TaxID=1962951 RepID=UPI0025BCE314|nr:ParB/RepB/Spo0J family partition protein [Desulfonatronospira sp.]
MKKQEKGLGKGLDALIKPSFYEETTTDSVQLNVQKLKPNPFQPRKKFSEESIQELASSIKENGVLQPILVRRNENQEYEIIAGERRWRASIEAGHNTVPALIREFDNKQVLAIALIENLQREDLNPMEQAYALQQLQSELGINQEELADKIGKSRPQLANILRLIKLPEEIRNMVEDMSLSPGHARALLGVKSETMMLELAQKIISKNLSVRQTEELVKNSLKEKKTTPGNDKKNNFAIEMENRIKQRLNEKLHVSMQGNENKGKLVFQYKNSKELDSLMECLGMKSDDVSV